MQTWACRKQWPASQTQSGGRGSRKHCTPRLLSHLEVGAGDKQISSCAVGTRNDQCHIWAIAWSVHLQYGNHSWAGDSSKGCGYIKMSFAVAHFGNKCGTSGTGRSFVQLLLKTTEPYLLLLTFCYNNTVWIIKHILGTVVGSTPGYATMWTSGHHPS